MQNKHTIYFSTYDDIKNPHYGGGGAIAVHQVAKRLTKNYDVRVLSWDYCGKKKETIDGVQYERFGFSSLPPKVAMFFYQIALPFIAQRKSFTVWLESFCPPFTTSFFPLFCNKPVVGVVHMLAAEDMERKYKLPFHIIQNTGLKLYKHIIVTTDVLKLQMQKISPKTSFTVISNGIPQIFAPIQKKEKFILFLGRIEVDQKGIDLLFEAFSKFHSQHKDYKLILAGSGTKLEEEKMQNLLKEAKFKNAVELIGKVEGAKKEKLLREAACIVIPSRFETFSLVALEAMAHGTPIVCFAIKGLSWIPNNAAKKVKTFDIHALARVVEETIFDKSFMQEQIIHANAFVKHFTWDEIAKQYKKYLENICHS